MADSLIDLNSIIYQLEKFGNLSLIENTYIKGLGGFTDISANIKIGNTIITGRGLSSDPNISLKKAVYEAFQNYEWYCYR